MKTFLPYSLNLQSWAKYCRQFMNLSKIDFSTECFRAYFWWFFSTNGKIFLFCDDDLVLFHCWWKVEKSTNFLCKIITRYGNNGFIKCFSFWHTKSKSNEANSKSISHYGHLSGKSLGLVQISKIEKMPLLICSYLFKVHLDACSNPLPVRLLSMAACFKKL